VVDPHPARLSCKWGKGENSTASFADDAEEKKKKEKNATTRGDQIRAAKLTKKGSRGWEGEGRVKHGNKIPLRGQTGKDSW